MRLVRDSESLVPPVCGGRCCASQGMTWKASQDGMALNRYIATLSTNGRRCFRKYCNDCNAGAGLHLPCCLPEFFHVWEPLLNWPVSQSLHRHVPLRQWSWSDACPGQLSLSGGRTCNCLTCPCLYHPASYYLDSVNESHKILLLCYANPSFPPGCIISTGGLLQCQVAPSWWPYMIELWLCSTSSSCEIAVFRSRKVKLTMDRGVML